MPSYTEEQKRRAVETVEERGGSVTRAMRRLGYPTRQTACIPGVPVLPRVPWDRPIHVAAEQPMGQRARGILLQATHIAPANRSYRFVHNKNARRQFEGSCRAQRQPLSPKPNRPIGANSQ